MGRSRVLRIRMDRAMVDQLRELAEAWNQPVSTVARDAIADLLRHPQRYVELLAARRPDAFEDERMPQQALAWERDRQQLVEACDLDGLLAQMTARGPVV